MNPENITAWPTCPKCGQRRETACPVCGTAGHDFPPAEYPEGEQPGAEAPMQLICTQCDELFEPRYYRRCSQCGYDFGDGMAPPVADTVALSPRVLWVIIAMVACVLGLIIYFATLLR